MSSGLSSRPSARLILRAVEQAASGPPGFCVFGRLQSFSALVDLWDEERLPIVGRIRAEHLPWPAVECRERCPPTRAQSRLLIYLVGDVDEKGTCLNKIE